MPTFYVFDGRAVQPYTDEKSAAEAVANARAKTTAPQGEAAQPVQAVDVQAKKK